MGRVAGRGVRIVVSVLPLRGAGRLAGATGTNLTVTVRAEPEGIFRTVESRAVQIKRSGGRPAWEIV